MRLIPDPRSTRKKKHDYAEILVCLIAAYLTGRTTLRRALKWCRLHLKLLQEKLNLSGGIPSIATVSRMLSSIDEDDFCNAFMQWMTELLRTEGTHIIIDGKALRGATERIKGGNTPYILNAIEAATNLVVAQLAIDVKGNEKTAIPRLLELLAIKNSLVTIDAAGTTTDILQIIVNKGAHYLFTIKKNQPNTYDEIMEYFDSHIILDENQHEMSEKNRERMEYRKIKRTFFIPQISNSARYPNLKQIALLEQTRIKIEKDDLGNDITPDKEAYLRNGTVRKPKITTGDEAGDDRYRIGLVTDMGLTPQEMLDAKRRHWKIENGLHHVLDDTLREDRSPARKSKNNLAMLRKFVFNILQIARIREKSSDGFPEMMDLFADDSNKIRFYVLQGIESFY